MADSYCPRGVHPPRAIDKIPISRRRSISHYALWVVLGSRALQLYLFQYFGQASLEIKDGIDVDNLKT